MENLNRCPICGGIVKILNTSKVVESSYWIVECTTCGCNITLLTKNKHGEAANPSEAIREWNKRSDAVEIMGLL